MPDLIYPGKQFSFEVGGRVEDLDYEYRGVHLPDEGEEPQFWGVYARPNPEGLAMWVADFHTETDAREYAAWRAKHS